MALNRESIGLQSLIGKVHYKTQEKVYLAYKHYLGYNLIISLMTYNNDGFIISAREVVDRILLNNQQYRVKV